MHTQRLFRNGSTLPQVVVALAASMALGALALPMLGAMRSNSASSLAIARALGVGRAIEASAADARWYQPAFRSDGDGSLTHHSARLLEGGYAASPEDFTSPLAPGGGAPKAGEHVRQVDRLAFTVNAAIMPPEPLADSGTARHYRQVAHRAGFPQAGGSLLRADEPIAPASTLLVTEWLTADGYSALRQGPRVLSHRPIVPFLGATTGRSPEREATAVGAPFVYPDAGQVFDDNADFREALVGRGATEINAMGRGHTGDGAGRAALIMLDGSARLATPRQSVEQRLWGEAFHSITGGQRVR